MKMACSSCCVDETLSQLKSVISSFPDICKLNISSQKIPLRRKLRDLGSGDIVLPKFFKLEPARNIELLLFVKHVLIQGNVPVAKVLKDEHNLLTFFLKRSQVMKEIVTEVDAQKSQYGMSQVRKNHIVFFNPVSNPQRNSPTDYRVSIVASHTANLLKANGYDVHFLPGKMCGRVEVNCSADLLTLEPEQACGDSISSLVQRKNQSSCQSYFLCKLKKLLEEQDQGENRDSHFLYVKDILKEHALLIGKDGVDINLQQIEVLTGEGETSVILKEAIYLEDKLHKIREADDKIAHNLQNDKTVYTCMHVAAQQRAFRQQQVLMLALAISDKKFLQSLLVVGPVMCDKDSSMDDIYRKRYDQMKQASEMRSGQKCEGLEWTTRLNLLTTAGLTFDLLGAACHGPLHLDLATSTPADNRLGAFVLYNTARLASLLSHFSQEVEKGTYPPLPPIDTVDFSLLREQADWELAFLYISSFPDIVRDSVEIVSGHHGQILAKVYTHKVIHFLTTFSKSLSSYYSRYHILGGGEPHLLPLMYARLYLIKAGHQVLVSALHLLDITALDQL